MQPHLIEDRIPVLPLLHIDEIDNNQPTYIAETYLPGDFRRGFAVDLENRIVLVPLILVRACVNVDSYEGLRLVDYDGSSRR